MSNVDAYKTELPYLKRFAGAVTGSKKLSDLSVLKTLETLNVPQNNSLDPYIDNSVCPKITLYKIFADTWLNVASKLDGDALKPDDRVGSEASLSITSPMSRLVFLLDILDGFSLSEISYIIQKTEDEAASLLQKANQDVEQALATNVLIIEDESIIALDIENLVNDLGHSVGAIAATRTEAVKAAKTMKPGLILADVRLADGSSGIEAVSEILNEVDVPVIFITSFPERLLFSDDIAPSHLISKPFQHHHFKDAIRQALFFHG